MKCVDEDSDLDSCPEDCRAKSVWQQVGQAIDGVLDSITLEDLVNKDAGRRPFEKKRGMNR